MSTNLTRSSPICQRLAYFCSMTYRLSFLLYFMLLTPALRGNASEADERLNDLVQNRIVYEKEKEEMIGRLKSSLGKKSEPEEEYRANLLLIDAYHKFQSDSAVVYLNKNLQLAKAMDNPFLTSESAIELARLYAKEGLYIESKSLLEEIRRENLTDTLLPAYYESYLAFYNYYGQSTDNSTYYAKSGLYRDSLLTALKPGTLAYEIELATKRLYDSRSDLAEKQLLTLLKQLDERKEERAVVAYFLGVISRQRGDLEKQKYYFSLSATTDLLLAVKDNASLQSLALTYFDLGEVEKAYQLMEASINDASYGSFRYRTIDGAAYYAIINTAFRKLEAEKNLRLKEYIISISFLSIGLLLGLFFILRQMKRLKQTRLELNNINQQLKRLNQELTGSNRNLFEANHINEEYIAHFSTCARPILKSWNSSGNLLIKKSSAASRMIC